jgi:ABC-type transport system involved in multi-copper enzyme maturation permease subunit
MAANSTFERVSGRGRLRGFGNLLGHELARWWKTRMWWIQCLIWAVLTVALLNLWGEADRSFAVTMFGQLTGVFQAVGVVVIMQGALVGEKIDGRAAWILSKPATRPAYLLSKLIAYGLGMLVTMVLLSGVILYTTWLMQSTTLPGPIFFLEALGVVSLSHLWYLTLTLMLAVLFSNRIVILGISGGLLALSDNLARYTPVGVLLPWNLTVAGWGTERSPLIDLLSGQPIPSFLPILAVVAAECVLFVLIALWRFSHQEL